MTTNQKLDALRQSMKAAGVDACLIPTADPHISEYLPEHWAARSYFSGFTGSQGTFVVTLTQSALWVDGRYFIQAERQIQGSEITLQRMGVAGVPTLQEYLKTTLTAGQTLAVDGMLAPSSLILELEQLLNPMDITIRSVDLISENWPNRPALPASKAWLLEERFAGLSAAEKLAQVRKALAQQNANTLVVTRLDSVAWLLNLRGGDLPCTPFALGYCVVDEDSAVLFLDKERLDSQSVEALQQQGVSIQPYTALVDFLKGYSRAARVLVDTEGTNWAIYQTLQQNSHFTMLEGEDPIQALKAVKNPVEIQNIRNAHIKDGVAMVRFQIWLEQQLAAGSSLTEVDVDAKLFELRTAQPDNIGISFDTIAAYGANAAMMHYHATPESCSWLEPRGFLLVDSGGQYLDGTTDITRTYALGPLTEQEKDFYTYVLKAHIDLAQVQFLEGCTGSNLDIMARAAVWKHGIDYRCGTGHGIGFVGNVHEGPQRLHTRLQKVAFEPGMIVTNEPGIYEEGLVGIRIENELLCELRTENQYGRFLGFEVITYCPIDLTGVRKELLTQDELEWLNAFHAQVYNTLKPHLTQEEAQWLEEKTKPLA